jgi:hypothetical protein
MSAFSRLRAGHGIHSRTTRRTMVQLRQPRMGCRDVPAWWSAVTAIVTCSASSSRGRLIRR